MGISAHVVTHPPSRFFIEDGTIEVYQLRAWRDNYIWILYDANERAAVVIDGPEAEPLDLWLETHPCDHIQIWNTHHHHDHIGVNRALLGRDNHFHLTVVGSASRAEEIPGIAVRVDEGDELNFGSAQFKVWRTDGHVDGHLCFVHSELVFCGDTLFASGCGYLFDGPPQAMYESLRRLKHLDPSTKVCCAHEYTLDNLRFAHFIEPGNSNVLARLREAEKCVDSGLTTLPSTIALERSTNPFMRADEKSLSACVSRFVGQELSPGAETFAATRRLKDKKVHL